VATVFVSVRGGEGPAVVAQRVEPAAASAPAAPPVPTCLSGTVRRLDAIAVRVVRPTVAFRSPGAGRIARFGLVNVNGVRTVFSARTVRLDGRCRPIWYRVQLPLRPNGITGWVAARDVERFEVATRVVVDLSERRVTVFRGTLRVLVADAAIGRPSTPTPTGRFYVNQRLLAADQDGAFGPGGVGISAFSPALTGWAQGGPIAIHGTNRPDLIGQAISHGCVRIENSALLRLLDIAPEGTPVVIRA
jgi:hypothetical protein